MASYIQEIPRKIFFDGDSLFATSGVGNLRTNESVKACYNSLTGAKPVPSYNAVSAKTVAQLISDFPTKIGQWSKPNDIVVCNAATNSLGSLQNPTTVFNEISDYVDLVKSYGLKIVYVTMTARTIAYANMEADRLTLNISIRNLSTLDGVGDAGANTLFDSVADTSNATYYTDGLHMTSAGSTIYGQSITPAIQPLL